MKKFIIFNGFVEEIEKITSCEQSKNISVKLKNGTKIANLNSYYICNKNGKSKKTNEYLNYKQWVRKDKVFTCENAKIKIECNVNILNNEIVNIIN